MTEPAFRPEGPGRSASRGRGPGRGLVRGLGIGWRAELAVLIERRRDLGFVEVLAEHFDDGADLSPLVSLRERGVARIVHSIDLSLGSAARPEHARLRRVARLAARVDACLISDHLAWVRSTSHDSGHLLPLPRTREAARIAAANIRIAQDRLPAPLAIENIAATFEWPQAELTETQFLTEVLEHCDAPLVLDLANLYANARNFGYDAQAFLDDIPLERLAYVHVAGGVLRDGFLHDSHGHPVGQAVFDLLQGLTKRVGPVAAMLERDDRFPPDAEIHAELDRLVRYGLPAAPVEASPA